MAPLKHVALRTCIATHQKMAKNDLIRLVFDSLSKTLHVDLKGKMKGRGANITPSIDSLEIAFKKRALERALKLEKRLTTEEQEQLKTEFSAAIAEKEFRPKNKPVRIKLSQEAIKKAQFANCNLQIAKK